SVSWESSYDISGVWYYELYRNDVKISTTNELSFIDAGYNLIDGVTYYYKVVGVDIVGNKNNGVIQSIVCDKSGVSVVEFNLSNNGYFSPNNDGVNDLLVIEYRLSANANVSVIVKNQSNLELIRLEDNQPKNGNQLYSVVWNGQSQDGTLLNEGSYIIELVVRDISGKSSTRKKTAWVDFSVDVSNLKVSPQIFSPNNDGYEDQTLISYTLGEDAYVTIMIYDKQNNLIKKLQENLFRPAGVRSVYWDGKNEAGVVVADGIYVIAISVKDISGNTKTTQTSVEVDNYFGKVVGYIYEDNGIGNIPGNRIPSAICSIEELGYSVESDEAGYYSIAKIPPDPTKIYTLKVSKSGYITTKTRFSLSVGELKWCSVALPRGYNVYSSTVSPPLIEHTPIGSIAIKDNLVKLIAKVTDENGIRNVTLRYRIKTYNNFWHDWVEKKMVSLNDSVWYLKLLKDIDIPDNAEGIEYTILSDNNLGLFESSEIYYIEFKPEVEAIIAVS
ncbi:MAG: hypothetical protein N2Z73_04040, partial [Endomicrobia bacterium]|nr:hypothetical protein [Endomicrobiia bacterium]